MINKLREKILNTKDIKSELVTVEEWDATLEVRALTGKQRANVITSALGPNGRMDFEKLYPELVISSCYDPETKERVFEKTDKDLLNEKSGGALEKIAQVVIKLSGLKPDSVDESAKNF